MSKLSNSNQDRAKELYPAVSGSYTRLQSLSDYDALYKQSTTEPKKFYSDAATNFLVWDTPFDPENPFEFDMLTGSAKWFEGGELNACYNCVDKHLDDRGDQVALIWESDDGSDIRKVTFAELHKHVCKFANALEACEIKKGDRVCIYMPMILEAVYAMLACARIGAIHSVVFGGFSPDSIRNRILDAGCSAVITADGGRRGGLEVPLKSNIDQALTEVDCVHTVLVVEHTGTSVPMQDGRDKWYGEVAEGLVDPFTHTAIPMRSEDPLFILYTSGSTGKPKGVVHSTAGYLLGATMTFHYLFDYREDEVFWCTADVGWITGHTYIVYGPLANGATTLIYEGVPTYPDASRCWDMVERHQVSIFYTAPTAIRALMAQGDAFITKHSRKSLRLLGSVGEPINPEAWRWYYEVVGESRCPIIDSWWQTETGAAMITPLGSLFDLKPGSATRPFFGVEPVLLTPEGREVTTTDANGDMQGLLAIKNSWPGQIRTVYGDHQRMIDTYFKEYPGYYLTGDAARRDKDGYWWITGRVDDVLNVSGHRLGTAEVESALVAHPKVAEAAVVGRGHPIKGEGIYAFVTLVAGVEFTPALVKEMRQTVSDVLSPIAKPDWIQWAPSLPKTRSGKIMRRILRKISVNEIDDLGDTTTLADPAVLDDLIKLRED